MTGKSFWCAALTAAAAFSAGAAGITQNFDKGFQPGPLTGNGRIPGGTYVLQATEPGVFSIVDGGVSAPHALKIERIGVVGMMSLRPAAPIPRNTSFRAAFKTKLASGHTNCVWIGGAGKAKPTGGVVITGGAPPRAYNDKMAWTGSGMKPTPADQWVTVEIVFDAQKKNYEVSVTGADGQAEVSGIEFPWLSSDPVNEIKFLNSLPKGNTALVDDVVLEPVATKAAGSIPASGILCEQNFDKDFRPGSLSGSGRCAGAKWRIFSAPDNFLIVTDPVASPPHALKVLRDGFNGYFALRPSLSVPAGRNYTIEFAFNPKAGSGVVVLFVNAGGVMGGVLAVADNPVKGYNISQAWELCGNDTPILPAAAWTRIKVDFNVNAQYYTISTTTPDGKTVRGTAQHPFLTQGAIEEMRFVNILPQKSYAFIDDVSMRVDSAVSLDGRDDFAPNASSVDPAFAAMLKGEAPFVPGADPVDMEFSPPVKIAAVKFTAPAGGKLPQKVTLRAQNAGGAWIDLGKELAIDPATGFIEFKTVESIHRFSMRFSGGGAIAKIGVYSPVGTPQGILDRERGKKLDAEYRLPVYDRQYAGCDRAELKFVNHTDKPLKVRIDLHDRLADRDAGSQTHIAPPGESSVFFDLNQMPNGEYVTTITDLGQAKGGRFRRLLRHWTAPDCAAKPRVEMTGEKMFFPDGFFLSQQENIRFTTGVGKTHLVKRGTPGDNDGFIVYGDAVGFDASGNLCVNYHTLNRLWQTASAKHYHAVAAGPDDLDHWTSEPGRVKLVPSPNPVLGEIPADEKSDWGMKPGPDGKITYRFYDPARDGKIDLRQLQCRFISYAAPGTVGYADNNWGVMVPAPATVWTVWYKSPGEALIVGRKPLVSGFPGGGNLEPPDSGSDLGFGQWLEDGGKTLCFGFGRHLARYMPYRAEYDNLFDRARIVGIWRTRDGIHWEQGYVAPPDTSKPVADQHYGGNMKRVPHGAGLRMSFLNRYSALYQQISWEVIYSWDGFRWTRFQREPQFFANGPLGDWTHCGGYIGDSAVERDGKVYQLMTWINDHYHFQSEIVHGSVNKVDHMTADYMKRKYSPRKLEKWPYFEKHFGGSWERLAEHTRNATSSVGVIEYRKDGYFYAVAGDAEGHMVTTAVSAKGGLTVNAEIGEGGYIEFKLLTEDGSPISGYEKRIEAADGVALPVFDSLPEGRFKVDMRLKNARIYTLNF